MRVLSKLNPLAVAVSLGVSAVAAPMAANADMSASFAVSNMYLWRGINISDPGAAVSGSLDYSHESGFYAGLWTSSEGDFDGSSEFDTYFGFSGEAGSFGYDVMYVNYHYPYAGDSESYTDFSDLVISLSVADFGFSMFYNLAEPTDTADAGDYIYYTLSYSYEDFGFTYGGWSNDDTDSEYSHVTISFAATDELSFALSSVVDEAEPGSQIGEAWGVDSDPVFQVTWSQSYDL